MPRLLFFRIAVFASFAGLVALAATDCTAKTYIDCIGLCENVVPCNDTYDQCLAFCTAQQDKCERVGHPAAFLTFVSCTSEAGFSCDDAGDPIANPPCGPAQAELVQCDSKNDAALPIPQGSIDASLACADAESCLACCVDAYPKGAKEYAAAVSACVCGPSCTCRDVQGNKRTCQSQCVNSACAKVPVMPTQGEACDLCLSSVIDEESPDVGACVVPITERCNEKVDCALYVNCVSQSGCTN
jgi:hypothetical protein